MENTATGAERGAIDDEGEGGKLALLYRRHADNAVRLAYLLTGDKGLAEDIVQEAFVRLARRLAHLRDEGAFPAYLRRTVVNLANSHFRHRRVERAYVEREGRMPPSDGTQPDVATRQSMRDALLRLPERQRAAIVLRYFEDLPDETTAEILRCSRATVRSLVARGVAALRGQGLE